VNNSLEINKRVGGITPIGRWYGSQMVGGMAPTPILGLIFAKEKPQLWGKGRWYGSRFVQKVGGITPIGRWSDPQLNKKVGGMAPKWGRVGGMAPTKMTEYLLNYCFICIFCF
jgi:hypothetical protein